MPPSPTIRRATAKDMREVARFAARLVRFHHALDPKRFLCDEPLEPGYERWLSQELKTPKAVIVVAEEIPEGGARPKVVGYAYGRMETRDWNALLDACGALHDVFVDDGVRGRGVGGALVEAVIQELREMGAPRVVLHTATQNEAAQKLFDRLGFRRTMVEMTRELE